MANKLNTVIKKEFSEETPGHVTDAKYFYFDSPENKNSELTILCGGYEQCAPDFNIDRKNFPFFAAIFTVSGKGTFQTKGNTYQLSYGSLMAFSSKTPYQLIADRQSPMEQFFLLFTGNQAKELLRKSKIEQKGVVKVANPQAILNNFKQILRTGLNQTEYAHEICCNYLKAILLEQADERHDKYINSVSYENFQRCKTHLENNFIKINSSSQLADQCGFNIRYIARLFRKYNDTRPHEYLMNLKMNKAASLLITTNFNINQIAKMTGIEDPYYFSRVFKKKFKLAPKEYRKSFYARS